MPDDPFVAYGDVLVRAQKHKLLHCRVDHPSGTKNTRHMKRCCDNAKIVNGKPLQ
jgi:hypothetical protein